MTCYILRSQLSKSDFIVVCIDIYYAVKAANFTKYLCIMWPWIACDARLVQRVTMSHVRGTCNCATSYDRLRMEELRFSIILGRNETFAHFGLPPIDSLTHVGSLIA